jgi:DnaJ domain
MKWDCIFIYNSDWRIPPSHSSLVTRSYHVNVSCPYKSPVLMTASYYDVLNVPSTASLATIKESYRILVKQYHPDKIQDISSRTLDGDLVETTDRKEKPFLLIQAAWECLRDADQRRRYDESLSQQQQLYIQQQERSRQKNQNAIPIMFHDCQSGCSGAMDDLPVRASPVDRVGLDEEHVVDWFYRCRCGYEIYVAQSYASSIDQQLKLLPYDTDESFHQPDSMFVQCIGCTLLYNISPLFTSDPEQTVSEAFEQGFSNHKSFTTKKAKT